MAYWQICLKPRPIRKNDEIFSLSVMHRPIERIVYLAHLGRDTEVAEILEGQVTAHVQFSDERAVLPIP